MPNMPGNDTWIRYTQPKIDYQAVCHAVKYHKSFELQAGHTVHNLPNFGQLSFYGDFTDEEEDEICTQEAFRLVQIGNSTSPVKLQGIEDMLGQADRDGYYRLHWLGLRLIQALRICEHDVYVILAENMNFDGDYMECIRIQAALLDDFDPSTDEERFPGTQQLEGESFDRCNQAVVDYTTGMLIKVMLQCFRGDHWVYSIIATVARISAKMKLIGRDLPGAVGQTLQNGKDSRIRINQRESRNHAYRPKDLKDVRSDHPEAEKTNVAHAGQARKYFWEMKVIYGAVINMLIESLTAFAVSNSLAPGTDNFESSVGLYESFISSEQMLVCQQRDGAFGAASHPGITRVFSAGYQVCVHAWEALDRGSTSPRAKNWTLVEWNCSFIDKETGNPIPSGSRKGSVRISSMMGVIAATVPYTMISGNFSATLDSLMDRLSFGNNGGIVSPLLLVEQDKIICSASVRTSSYETSTQHQVAKADASALSQTFLFRNRTNGEVENLSDQNTPSQLSGSSKPGKETFSWGLGRKSKRSLRRP